MGELTPAETTRLAYQAVIDLRIDLGL